MRRPLSDLRPFGPIVASSSSEDIYAGMSQLDFKFNNDIRNPYVNEDRLTRICLNAVTQYYDLAYVEGNSRDRDTSKDNLMYAPDSQGQFIAVFIDTDSVVVDTLVNVRETVTSSLIASDMRLKLERMHHTCPADLQGEIVEVLDEAGDEKPDDDTTIL